MDAGFERRQKSESANTVHAANATSVPYTYGSHGEPGVSVTSLHSPQAGTPLPAALRAGRATTHLLVQRDEAELASLFLEMGACAVGTRSWRKAAGYFQKASVAAGRALEQEKYKLQAAEQALVDAHVDVESTDCSRSPAAANTEDSVRHGRSSSSSSSPWQPTTTPRSARSLFSPKSSATSARPSRRARATYAIRVQYRACCRAVESAEYSVRDAQSRHALCQKRQVRA